MNKRLLFYAASFALALTGCTDDGLAPQPSLPGEDQETTIPADAASGELLIKFDPMMTDLLDQAFSRAAETRGAVSRSGIPSTDEVLDILGAYSFERVFPVDKRNEERTRQAGLHLWYRVKFDENTDLQDAMGRLRQLGEVSKVQTNARIKRVYDTRIRRTYLSETALRQRPATRADGMPFTDPGLPSQWGYHNTGDYSFANANLDLGVESPVIAGCDVNCTDAWQLCAGDPSIIVAVLDEGVMNTHPDLRANIWVNEGEREFAGQDADGNGYKDDRYGYNFVTDSGEITWSDPDDTGHGTHVAGTIAAVNGNGIGVCGIAGGDGTPGTGVKIMSCQVFSGANSVSLDGEARAIKYAADNGAVILQCSWGYNSGSANAVEGYTPGPSDEDEWAALYPLEKEALDYFIQNAGSPNGVIDGGIAVFASGNEYAGLAGFPGAYSECVSVAAVAADFTPSCFSNYGDAVDISAPGGDTEYYGKVGMPDDGYWVPDPAQTGDGATTETLGSILSTLVREGQPAYGYMEGTSMACPHVSGVAALGLSYAAKQHRHLKAAEFRELLKQSVKPLDGYYADGLVKTYFRNHNYAAASPTQMELGRYIGKMGTGLADAGLLLRAVADAGSDMRLPNVYVAEGNTATVSLAACFPNGENLSYTATSSDDTVVSVSVDGTVMTVTGIKTGSARITVQASDGTTQSATATVRKKANDNGWM